MAGLGGRPSREGAAQLGERILDAATARFLTDGYAATSIEAVAAQAGVAKRTFYARFEDKSALFRGVVARLVTRWLDQYGHGFPPPLEGGGLRDALLHTAVQVLDVGLTEEALALHRIVVAESGRFPELAAQLHAAGTGIGIERIAALLRQARPALNPDQAAFAAEQFLALVLSGPQRRALGLGPALSEAQLRTWAESAVDLFLQGIGAMLGPEQRKDRSSWNIAISGGPG